MSELRKLLTHYRDASQTQREKGTYFEELILQYLKYEPRYSDLYSDVWTYADWAEQSGLQKQDTGIDLVAKTHGTDEFHAIQCKLYAEDYKVRKEDIDSFFTASGKKPFTHRIIVSTTNQWTHHAEDALQGQTLSVNKIDLYDLENSLIDWSRFAPSKKVELRDKKKLRPHQTNAVNSVLSGLEQADRGKLIMACGTGKTFTSLKIAEKLAGKGGRVLFLVPSLALLSQTLTEWTQESKVGLHSFAVCSDSDVGKKRKKDDDTVQTFMHELSYPATTNSHALAREMQQRHAPSHMSVVFGTYHSIDVVSQAQKKHGLPAFDFIICDEAHRTTGAVHDGEDESHFVKIHNNDYVAGTKRLYMTATPKIYASSAKAIAENDSITLCSMDDPALYGNDLHVLTFSQSVQRGLLVDYKVIVLAVGEDYVNERLQNLLKDENHQLKVDDAARIIGCWKGLAKQGLFESRAGNESPMQRAVAFCQVIEPQKGARVHKVSSKHIANMFQAVVEAYQQSAEDDENIDLICHADHVDGSMNATQKEEKLVWLKEDPPADTCRVLCNVRCLSEGVDVPALDAVMFLTPRNSQVDVVQSVGRVMRLAPGKERGYVILPVVIPAGMEADEALDNNKVYKVVWDVLQALRSHDDRFDATINKMELDGPNPAKMEVITITDKISRRKDTGQKTIPKKPSGKRKYTLGGAAGCGEPATDTLEQTVAPLEIEIGEIERAIYAKLVKKVGRRTYWEDWATDIGRIAATHISRINALLANPANTRERAAFEAFAHELRDDINESITDEEVVEMLAQHLITKPVFDALFENYSFAESNPISVAMQDVLDALHEHRLEKEADTLEHFYASVRMRASGIRSAEGKQKIVLELYDKFFKKAFPRMSERLGIVYTPVEVVDFIIHSVEHVLETEFDQTLGSKGVHIVDPFTGTGTFITRLLQSGIIRPEELAYKYENEIHANEIVLLAYYIAAINIESVYHSLVGTEGYKPFTGICLTDTFQMYEKEDLVSKLLEDNSERRKRQQSLDIRVIFGNPPYSIGQDSANDNNQNVAYPVLDERILGTYANTSQAITKKGLYDSYIRAIRWASDRIGESGVIGFVTNAGFVESGTADGLRKCLAEEFSSIYIFHLRGNARTKGELRRREKDNIFDVGSRAPVAISILVKNPDAAQSGQIHFHDIGDYLTREQKLGIVRDYHSIQGITNSNRWVPIVPDTHGDWLNQRDDSFSEFIVLGDKRTGQPALFENYSLGLGTNRDVWCYSFSNSSVGSNMKRMIAFYNAEANRFMSEYRGASRKVQEETVNGFINADPKQISWSVSLKQDVVKGKCHVYDPNCIIVGLYRPFTKQWAYFSRQFNERVFQMPQIFPEGKAENLVIMTSAKGAKGGFSSIISNVIVDLNSMEAGAQCFPLYLYEPLGNDEDESGTEDMLMASAEQTSQRYTRRDALTDEGLAHFHAAYPGEHITKEDVFYYIYGILHSPEYRTRYADNLSKELPRIPCVKKAEDFWAYSKAGRELAHWHLNYETVEPYPDATVTYRQVDHMDDKKLYYVTKMRYGKNGKEKDLTQVIYNDFITVSNIPLEAHDYTVNGRSAIEWVVERQGVRTDKASGIVNDANDWAVETMNNPKYPLELLLRVITVSLETNKIVSSLPKLELD